MRGPSALPGHPAALRMMCRQTTHSPGGFPQVLPQPAFSPLLTWAVLEASSCTQRLTFREESGERRKQGGSPCPQHWCPLWFHHLGAGRAWVSCLTSLSLFAPLQT